MRSFLIVVVACGACGGSAETVDKISVDGMEYCVTVVPTGVAIRKHCTEPPVTISAAVPVPSYDEIVLPPLRQTLALAPYNSPRWRAALAPFFARGQRVSCETPSKTCQAPGPLAALLIDASKGAKDGVMAYTPHGQDGLPAMPAERELVLLDEEPRHASDDPAADSVLDGAHGLFVRGGEVTTIKYPSDTSSYKLRTVASCAEYDVIASDELYAVVDKTTKKWSWILAHEKYDGATAPAFHRVHCRDGIVFSGVAGTRGETEFSRTIAIDPKAGRFSIDSGRYDEALGRLVANHRVLTPAQIKALLGGPLPPPMVPECSDPTTPLLLRTTPCKLDGLIVAKPTFSSSGFFDWYVVRGDAFHHFGASPIVDVDRDENGGQWDPDTGPFVAPKTCAPARADCPLPDPLTQIVAGYTSIAWPRWEPGVAPIFPPPAYVEFTDISKHPRHIVQNFRIGPPLEVKQRCGNFEVWSSPYVGAVIDYATKRWAWLEVGTIDNPIRKTTCEGTSIRFTYEHHFFEYDLRDPKKAKSRMDTFR